MKKGDGTKKVSVEKIFTGPTEKDYEEMNKKLGLNNIKVETQPTLLISEKVHAHIRALHVKYPSKEWLGLCKVEPQGSGVFLVTDMIHPQQEASSGEVSATEKGLDWAYDYLVEKQENLSQWNLILHSHHHMGVFWSGTDDKARLSLNDGRTLAWAVVTAYHGEPNSGQIDYKGCINFYKPYNIEIDATVMPENDRDIYQEIEQFINQDEVYQEELKEYKKKKLDELFEENIQHIQELSDQVDYSKIVEYLGLDITKELVDNYSIISTKIPNPQVEEYLKALEEQAEQEAEEKVEKKEEEVPQELQARLEWHEVLDKQIEEAQKYVPKYTSWYDKNCGQQTGLFNNRDFNTPSGFATDIIDNTPTFIDEDLYTIYTIKRFPTAYMVKQDIGLWEIELSVMDGEWRIRDKWDKEWKYVEDYIDDMQFNSKEYMC